MIRTNPQANSNKAGLGTNPEGMPAIPHPQIAYKGVPFHQPQVKILPHLLDSFISMNQINK